MKHNALRRAAPSTLRWVALAASLTLLSACSVLKEDKVDYTTAKRGNDLEVPPDLTQLSRQSRFALPSDVVSASGLQNGTGAAAPLAGTAPQSLQSFTLERSGSQRWLVAQLPAEKLWGPVRDFWKSNGFELTQSEEALGIMETDWAENRAKLPQDFIRSTIGKVFDGLYSTGERDKYRTRLERRADGGTEIYISHRGMQEVFTDATEERTAWQPRPPDPEMEAEFLRRLMVSLGASPEQAAQTVEQAKNVSSARLVQRQDEVWAEVGDGLDRAWRRVGLALDRTGFTVEDRNRSTGTYRVRFVPLGDNKSSGGWFSKKSENQPVRYQILLQGEGSITRVQVQNEQGQALNDANAQRILNVLVNDLN